MPDPNSCLVPTRSAALDRLARFAPLAGRQYAAGRNTDPGPGEPGAVSRLSPYVRYRLITERETVATVLAEHGPSGAEKYVQEVLWRTYWKGWLELRPAVWSRFLEERDRQIGRFADARAIAAAENGATGIDGFDDWARELVATGYLHNHARMWFASIWIFTLRLPWALGAGFFLRHLLDADAASNTLSWRWVAGLQTAGKTYLATTENIARYTNGRFAPVGLAQEAVALTEPPVGPERSLPAPVAPVPGERSLLLVTHEDLHPESVLSDEVPIKAAIVTADADLLWGDKARAFVASAAEDTAARVTARFSCPTKISDRLDAATLAAAAHAAGVRQIVTPYAPVGPLADRLADIAPILAREGVVLAQTRRQWDAQFWPHAQKGFFAFRKRIPDLLREEGLS
ncbi:FAD-binding domain-containing protein [Aurantimonas sp. A2-1-M11]|uniref:FAD-binding domain-containing protein n=1 Tax=Aurantimonas sp. A2-1-M11 TaxID=3113712 RepID=UPI002F9414BB